MNSVVLGWPLVFAVVLLAVLATLVTGLAGLGRWSQAGTATVRAVAQLAVVSVLIGAVIKSLPLTAAFLLAMITVAAGTSAHRITGHLRWRAWWAGVAIAAGAIPPLAVLILTGTLPASPAALLPTGGILIGGAMTATSLAGRRVTEELTHHRGSYEAALSLGMTRRQSVDLVARAAGDDVREPHHLTGVRQAAREDDVPDPPPTPAMARRPDTHSAAHGSAGCPDRDTPPRTPDTLRNPASSCSPGRRATLR